VIVSGDKSRHDAHLVLSSVRYSFTIILITVTVAVLIDLHTTEWRGLKSLNRFYDGIILATAAAIVPVAQFVERLVSALEPLSVWSTTISLAPSIIISYLCGFAMGVYLPTTASRNLVQAKHTLNHCADDMYRLG
jgi:uncharacterized membrane protein (DUF441 family)